VLKLALTGGIATGKSYVLERFRRLGVPCLEADVLAHGVMAPGTEATAAIAARFGREVIGEDGAVDRHRLGPIVFSDPDARHALEAIVHPGVYRAIRAGLSAFERIDGPLFAVVDVPLLYETGRAGDFDAVAATLCAPGVQLRRLRKRGLDETQARQRLAAQIPAAEKAARADFIVRTDGTFAETDTQVDNIVAELRDRITGRI
jgi:dephospho-CoA kinase